MILKQKENEIKLRVNQTKKKVKQKNLERHRFL